MMDNHRCFRVRDFDIPLGSKTLIMGIVNVTPDSFSDGGEAFGLEEAVNRALAHQENGADVIDIGGESTRPGSEPITLDEELKRVIPVLEALNGKIRIPVSIDTCKSEVAEQAIRAGAHIINDISAGTRDAKMPEIAAKYETGVILMHMQGTPRNMQEKPHYDDLLVDIGRFLGSAVKRFERAGITKDKILVDPGIGFGKLLSHNLELIRHVEYFKHIAAGVLLGPSRKSFLGSITGRDVANRLSESIAASIMGSICGGDMIRVHDVREVVVAMKVVDAIINADGNISPLKRFCPKNDIE